MLSSGADRLKSFDVDYLTWRGDGDGGDNDDDDDDGDVSVPKPKTDYRA